MTASAIPNGWKLLTYMGIMSKEPTETSFPFDKTSFLEEFLYNEKHETSHYNKHLTTVDKEKWLVLINWYTTVDWLIDRLINWLIDWLNDFKNNEFSSDEKTVPQSSKEDRGGRTLWNRGKCGPRTFEVEGVDSVCAVSLLLPIGREHTRKKNSLASRSSPWFAVPIASGAVDGSSPKHCWTAKKRSPEKWKQRACRFARRVPCHSQIWTRW